MIFDPRKYLLKISANSPGETCGPGRLQAAHRTLRGVREDEGE